MRVCPVCSSESYVVAVPAERLEAECRTREEFVRGRLTRPARPEELKDLTNFFHGEKADLLECRHCTLLVRNEHEPPPAQEYSEDTYDPGLMERLYPRYLDAFRGKEQPYRSLLPHGAKILEVGSHYGAFLQTATEWGWRAEGVDVGKDTSRFAKSKGFTVHTAALEECQFADQSFDGVFIWNCFEQIDDPKPTLQACRRVLKSNGVLVVRTPNGLFYSICQRLLQGPELQNGAKEFLLEALGYNNLLGFPYLYGHSRGTLERLIEPYGFDFSGVINSELLTLPLPQNPPWVEQEERAINTEMRFLANSVIAARSGAMTGPWIELWFRAR
jgi:2-polyprenyl-3-methyl-5-hydroxy-6-metoxy-1,4-benzoquinol methylase